MYTAFFFSFSPLHRCCRCRRHSLTRNRISMWAIYIESIGQNEWNISENTLTERKNAENPKSCLLFNGTW